MTAQTELVAGTWRIDPTRSELRFTIRHLKVQTVRGTVNGITGELVMGNDPAGSSVIATIDLRSVSTGMKMRDSAVRSGKLLDVETHPTATYRSTGVRPVGGGFVVDGQLTFLGVTEALPLQVSVDSLPAGPEGPEPCFTAKAELRRADFGFVLHEGPAFMDRSLGAVIQIDIRLATARS